MNRTTFKARLAAKLGQGNENDTNSTYCEHCACRITLGRCQHGVQPPAKASIQDDSLTPRIDAREHYNEIPTLTHEESALAEIERNKGNWENGDSQWFN